MKISRSAVPRKRQTRSSSGQGCNQALFFLCRAYWTEHAIGLLEAKHARRPPYFHNAYAPNAELTAFIMVVSYGGIPPERKEVWS